MNLLLPSLLEKAKCPRTGAKAFVSLATQRYFFCAFNVDVFNVKVGMNNWEVAKY